MTNPHDSIRVGSITLVYSSVRRGWLAPGGQVIRNPSKSNRLTKELTLGGISENEFRKQMGYAKSDSKYADMTSDERKANINKDIGTIVS